METTMLFLVGLPLLAQSQGAFVQEPSAPYSINYRETASWGDNKRPDISREWFAGRRVDGSTIERRDLENGVHQINLDLRLQGLHVMRNTKNNMVSILGDGQPAPAFVVKDCLAQLPNWNLTGITEETLLGFKVYHGHGPAVSTPEDPEDYEGWYAPDLGYQILKQIHYWKNNGKRDGSHTDLWAISATKTPPPDSDFEIPPGSVDTLPSEYMKAVFPGSRRDMQQMDAEWKAEKQSRAVRNAATGP